jgi:hypothetical protein
VKKLVALIAVIAASLAVIATSAGAAVSFDPYVGTGSVDRADVQQAFGWSNSETAHNAKLVTFTEWYFVYNVFNCSSGIQVSGGSVLEDGIKAKAQGQQFILSGLSGTHGGGYQGYQLGGVCPDGSVVATIAYSGTSGPALMAQFNGQEAMLKGF